MQGSKLKETFVPLISDLRHTLGLLRRPFDIS